MYIVVIFLPLWSAFLVGLLGRFLGVSGSTKISIFNLIVTWISALFIFSEVVIQRSIVCVDLWKWVLVNIGFYFDSLTSIMLVVITTISMLVHIYSSEYMKEDPHIIRFLSYLNLFTWFMIVLVTSNNLIQMFVGWEGVGICSYLLINFWFTRIQANKSAMKAIIVNRIGDVGIIISILLCYFYYGSVNYSIILNIDYKDEGQIIGFMFLIGVIGKSAQIGLHTWLPDAMEGPTPVSALIHAATMVTAGVFLLLRTHYIWNNSFLILFSIAMVGSITAFFGASIGLVQNDLKKIIAYSTCSQLGYMIFAIGVGSYNVSLFHLFNHAFFKALLFLSAGSIIHSISEEQDIRKMGSILVQLPVTYVSTLIGSLALMGLPFLTGFYSKDAIIEVAFCSYSVEGNIGHWLLCISAGFTAFYSFRLLNFCFISNPLGMRFVLSRSKESSLTILFVLIFLSICSIYLGFIMKELFIGVSSPYIPFDGSSFHHPIENEFINVVVKWIPVFLSFGGGLIGLIIYPMSSSIVSKTLFTFFSNKWHVDFLYNVFFVKSLMNMGYSITYKILDQGIIHQIGPIGLIISIKKFIFFNLFIQSGQINHYSALAIFGTVFFIFIREKENVRVINFYFGFCFIIFHYLFSFF